MSNFDNKTTRSVADIVANIMSEKLHPNQQKLDVHEPEKDKLTSDDFKKLRSMKKEEAEQLKEYESKGGSYTHKGTYGYAGKGAEHGDTDYDKENELAKAADKPKKPNRGKYGARQNFKRSTRVNEGFSSMFDALQEKGLKGLAEAMSHQEKTTMKHIPNPTPAQKQAAKDIKPGVAGYRDRIDMLKDAGVKEEVEELDEVSLKTATSAYVKRMGKDDDKSPVKAVKTMDHIAKKHGVVGVARAAKAADKEYGLNDTTHNKRKDFVRGVMAGVKEEVEQIDELSKSTLGSYANKATKDAATSSSASSNWAHTSDKAKNPRVKAAAAKYSDEEEARKQKRLTGVGNAVNRLAKEQTEIQVIDFNDVNGVQMSTIELDERELTAAETEKKEATVKSMKKNLQGFKERYGKDAKSVMYATATKQAKLKEETDSEHYKAGHEYASDHAQDSGFKVTARARKKEMLADNPHKTGTKEHADWHQGALHGHQTALDNM